MVKLLWPPQFAKVTNNFLYIFDSSKCVNWKFANLWVQFGECFNRCIKRIYGSYVKKLQVGRILKNMFLIPQIICLLLNEEILCMIDYWRDILTKMTDFSYLCWFCQTFKSFLLLQIHANSLILIRLIFICYTET